MKITNLDKVTLALLLEEGQARIEDLQFHLTLSRNQIRSALKRLVTRGVVVHETGSNVYHLASI